MLWLMLPAAVSVDADPYPRSPDVLPGTVAEMHRPAYWIARMDDPDAVIMTPERIKAMNRRYTARINSCDPFGDMPPEAKPDLSYWWPGLFYRKPDLAAMDGSAIADTVRARIRDEIDYLRGRSWGNALAVEYSAAAIDNFEREMALDRVPATVEPRKALTVQCARIRNIPSFTPVEVGISDTGKTRWDLWNMGIVDIATTVDVVHVSRSGEYLFVMCDFGFGWVRSDKLAFGDEELMERFARPDEFMVCTADRVLFYTDERCLHASGWFRLGDRLPLAGPGNGRKVFVPVRNTDGTLGTGTAWLAPDAAVHNGLVPYTRRNIVTIAFELLGRPYDWTGGWFGRQHETTYRDIFSCFGFDLPHHGALFTLFGDDFPVMEPDIGRERQYEVILDHEPFVTIQSCGGHCQLLLGGYRGEPIIFDNHGYGYTDAGGVDVETRRTCIGDMTTTGYFLERKVTFLELK